MSGRQDLSLPIRLALGRDLMQIAQSETRIGSKERLNVADWLQRTAQEVPSQVAVVCPREWSPSYRETTPPSGASAGVRRYATTSFLELDEDATLLARGIVAWGVEPGARLALLVRPGIEFVTLVFALLRAGVTIVLIDPGLGRRNMIRCIANAEPSGFVAVPPAQIVRILVRHKFPAAKWNVTVGRKLFWGGETLESLRALGRRSQATLPTTTGDDPAAIIFTSGSTGPPKGVLYTHRMFNTQVVEIQSHYGIRPGGRDLGCFPLFALFNSAMGVTTVFPEMDFSRPASADPRKLVDTATEWKVTQAFASPAVWRRLSAYCGRSGRRIPSLRNIFSCGAPVPAEVQRATLRCAGDQARMHTPYGATECLPVSTIEAAEILDDTAAQTDQGAGVCVGRKFDSIDWRVIRITDRPIATIDDAEPLPSGEIGELIVRGPQASPKYVTATDANELSKIADTAHASPMTSLAGAQGPPSFWHRMGDVGYFDEEGRFWYCGRRSHRVETGTSTLFTEQVEAQFNNFPGVRRSALVGIGPRGAQQPFIIIEPDDLAVVGAGKGARKRQAELFRSWRGAAILSGWPPNAILFHPSLPVDVRHNAKINREWLTAWASAEWHRHAGAEAAAGDGDDS